MVREDVARVDTQVIKGLFSLRLAGRRDKLFTLFFGHIDSNQLELTLQFAQKPAANEGVVQICYRIHRRTS